MIELFYVIIVYFGGYVIPVVYFIATLGEGRARVPMLWGVGIHSLLNFFVWALVFCSRKAGHSEYYWMWALLIPINIFSILYYIGALIYSYVKK